jgi:hypothetical protein
MCGSHLCGPRLMAVLDKNWFGSLPMLITEWIVELFVSEARRGRREHG